MKIHVSLSRTSKGFYTFQDLLNALHLGDYSVVGQVMLEYGKTETVHLDDGRHTIAIDVSRDHHGIYYADLNDSKITYYVLDNFNRVIKGFKSTDNIPVTMLRAIRYRDYKFTERYDKPLIPCKIYMFYGIKFKEGDEVKIEPLEFVNWGDCKNASKTRVLD